MGSGYSYGERQYIGGGGGMDSSTKIETTGSGYLSPGPQSRGRFRSLLTPPHRAAIR